MPQNLPQKSKSGMDPLTKLFVGYKNILLFIVYYFDFFLLVRTLFAPWKREYWRKQSRGFDPGEMLFVAVSNLISRFLGAGIRMGMIVAGFSALFSGILFGFPLSLLFMAIHPRAFIFSERMIISMRSAVWDWHYGYTPTADQYAYELYHVDHSSALVVGKEEEIKEASRVLGQSKGHNMLVVGEPGSGRHVLLAELAYQHIAKRFLVFDIVSFLKGKRTHSEQSAAVVGLLREVNDAGNVVLIINHFEHMLDFVSALEPYLASVTLHLVGVTTPDQYHDQLLPAKSIMKYMSIVHIAPLEEEDLREIVRRRTRHSTWGSYPEPVISLLLNASVSIMSLEQKGQPEAIITLLDEFNSFLKSHKKSRDGDTPQLKDLVQAFLTERLSMPSTAPLTTDEKNKLKELNTLLHRRIVSQDAAIEQIVSALRRRRLQLTDANRAIGSFLFLGPTGVGKTETAKALANIFFEDAEKLLRFDMARFQQKSQVAALTDELARAIRQQPYGVLLLDEIEKAHSDLLSIFLTILDEGYFHDSHHGKVMTTNLIIIATSNAGSEYIRELSLGGEESVQEAMGTLSADIAESRRASYLQQQVVNHILTEKLYTPEFINRFDAVVVYMPLSNKELKEIARMKIEKVREKLRQKHQKTFEITDALLERVVAEGVQKDFGAREIDRTIHRIVEDEIAEELLK